MNDYIIIAGKTEGFDYKDGLVLSISGQENAEQLIPTLLDDGYKIVIVSEVIARFDKFAEEALQ